MIFVELFLVYLQIGAFSFGGGYAAMPLIQSLCVDGKQWLTTSEFADLTTIAEMTPGPISINASTFVGTRLAGPLGAVICTIGCIIPSFIICLTLAHFYYKYRSFGGVQTVLSSLRPAVVALIGSAGASILMLGLFQSDIFSFSIADFRLIEFILFGGCLYILRKYKASAIAIIFGSGIVGTLLDLIKDFIF